MVSLSEERLEDLRAAYSRRQGLRNNNHAPTIIANDCVGGTMYHTLGLRFLSPTINLFFNPLSDYILFCRDVKYYVNCPLEDLSGEGQFRRSYPVGLLVGDAEHPSVPLYFMHYDTFENARLKWVERAQRIDYDNIYYVLHCFNAKASMAELTEFDRLPGKRLCVLHEDVASVGNKAVVDIDDDRPGKILEYRKSKPWKRYLEDVDYVSFLNGGHSPR